MAQPATLALVTLEEPYEGNARIHNRDAAFEFNLGFEPAVEEFYPDSNFGNDPRHRIQAGKRKVIRLVATDPENGSAIIPVEWAKLWFGDWDAVQNEGELRIVTGPSGTVKLAVPTVSKERDRVATIHGGYRYKNERGLKIDQIDNVPIGPPAVPHVVVRVLDHLGRPQKDADGFEFVHRPWDAYGYGEMFPDFEAPVASRRKKAIA